MKKLVACAVGLAIAMIACGKPQLDKTFSGFGFSVSYPSTYRLETRKDGVSIVGNITIKISSKKEPKITKDSMMPLLMNLQQSNKSKKLIFKPVRSGSLEYVLMEGLDDFDRYVFAYFVPVNGGMLTLELEPAYVNDTLTMLAQSIALSFRVTNYDLFGGK